jgi:hypothetical protein
MPNRALLAQSVHDFAPKEPGCSLHSRCYHRAPAASEAGRTAQADLSAESRFALLGRTLHISNRPLWQTGSAKVCVVICADLNSLCPDEKRRLLFATLGKRSPPG